MEEEEEAEEEEEEEKVKSSEKVWWLAVKSNRQSRLNLPPRGVEFVTKALTTTTTKTRSLN